MKIKQLHYFMAIATYLNYKTASDAADVSPSLLSQQVISLEDELGVKLFTRNKQKVILTAAGEELKRSVPALQKELTETIAMVYRMQEEENEVHTLHVGYEDFFARNIMLVFDNLLQEHVKEIRGIYNQFPGRELFTALRAGDIDMAFALLPSDLIPEEKQIRLLKQDELVMLVHQELYDRFCKNRLTDIAEYKPMCGYIYNIFGTEMSVDLHKQYGVKPKLKLCETIDEMLIHVESGLGYAILPRYYIEGRRNPGLTRICSLSEAEGNHVCLSVVYNEKKIREEFPGVEEVLDMMTDERPDCASCVNYFCGLNKRF